MQKQGHYIYIEQIFNDNFKNYENIKEDLLQEGYIAILKCEKKYDKTKGSFYNYCKKPVINAMLKFIEKEKKNTFLSYQDLVNENEETTFADITKNKEDEILKVEIKITINEIIDNFQENQKKIIKEFLQFDKTQTQIAKDLNFSIDYVNRVINRFREELKFIL